jgi:hypothetical protein
MTVRFAIGTMLTYLAAKFGFDLAPDVQQAILVIGAALVTVFMRRGIEQAPARAGGSAALLLLFAILFAGCAGPDLKPTVRIQTKTLAELAAEAEVAPVGSDGLLTISPELLTRLRTGTIVVMPEVMARLHENVRLGKEALK